MLVFAIINSVPRGTGATREWRNRQTRTFEGRVVIPYGFKSRLSHQEDSFIGILFLLRRSAHFEPSSAAPPCKNKEHIYAGMAELADALDSGSNGRKAVQVQVLLPAPIAESLDSQRFSLAVGAFSFPPKSSNLHRLQHFSNTFSNTSELYCFLHSFHNTRLALNIQMRIYICCRLNVRMP